MKINVTFFSDEEAGVVRTSECPSWCVLDHDEDFAGALQHLGRESWVEADSYGMPTKMSVRLAAARSERAGAGVLTYVQFGEPGKEALRVEVPGQIKSLCSALLGVARESGLM